MVTKLSSEDLLTGLQGFNLAHNEQESFFEVLGKDPRRLERFKNAMAFFHLSPGLATHHVYDLFDWKAHNKAKVVDVGGSHGFVAIELARRLPDLNFVVQDLPEVVVAGVKAVPKDVEEQIAFMPHDFFQVQPVKNADMYFLRWILHDWSDKYCVQILKCLVPAMKSGARMLINEVCVPETNQVSCYRIRELRSVVFFQILSGLILVQSADISPGVEGLILLC